MQALYSFFQHEKGDVRLFEKELFKSLDKIYDLYLSVLALLLDIHHVSLVIMDENKNKRLPSKEDITPNMKFANNSLLISMGKNKELKDLLEKKKINWQSDFDLVRRIFNEIKAGETYQSYLKSSETSIDLERDLIISIITEHLSENDVLTSLFEEKNIHWADDTFVAFNSVIRNLEEFDGEFKLQPLLKDEKDDLEFMSSLFNKTIIYHQQFEELIGRHTKNWEVERIANMDMLLMEMALAEILYIPNVPVKASLNEYIDISKEYSTPNSKTFVNGVLDNILKDLTKEDRVRKVDRK